MVNTHCDKCGRTRKTVGTIRRLNTGGNSGVYLCRSCWASEMKWRRSRNKSLSGKAKFPIRKFPKSYYKKKKKRR